MDCRRENRKDLVGGVRAHDKQRQRTTELHEDIEDLLRFGATFKEIIERGGYSSWPHMKRSLRRRKRYDLLEKLEAKALN